MTQVQKSMTVGPCWRLPEDIRDLLSHAKCLGLDVKVCRGAGYKARRYIRILGHRKVMDILESAHPWSVPDAEPIDASDGTRPDAISAVLDPSSEPQA